MTREELIQKIVEEVEDWDLEMLVESAKTLEEKWARELSDKRLIEWWNERCSEGEQLTKLKEADDGT